MTSDPILTVGSQLDARSRSTGTVETLPLLKEDSSNVKPVLHVSTTKDLAVDQENWFYSGPELLGVGLSWVSAGFNEFKFNKNLFRTIMNASKAQIHHYTEGIDLDSPNVKTEH